MAVSILIYAGAAQRVLDRMRLSDRAALILLGAVIVGSFIDLPLGQRLTLNVGGTIFIGLAVWLIATAGSGFEKLRAILAALVTAAALYLLTRVLGADPEQIILDPLYIYPIVAAICGYAAGRSRRSAFVAAVLGVFSLDIGRYLFLLRTGTAATVRVGGAGFFDTLVLAGILAVVIAELVGEVWERAQGGPRTEGRDPELLKHLQKPEAQPAAAALNVEAGSWTEPTEPPEEEPEPSVDEEVLLNETNVQKVTPVFESPSMINECNVQALQDMGMQPRTDPKATAAIEEEYQREDKR